MLIADLFATHWFVKANEKHYPSISIKSLKTLKNVNDVSRNSNKLINLCSGSTLRDCRNNDRQKRARCVVRCSAIHTRRTHRNNAQVELCFNRFHRKQVWRDFGKYTIKQFVSNWRSTTFHLWTQRQKLVFSEGARTACKPSSENISRCTAI